MQREIRPERAAVRPRVSPAGDADAEPVLLEELVADRLARRAPLHLRLIGPPGSGRRTALRHLAHRFGPRADLVLSDHAAGVEELERAPAVVVSIGASHLPHRECWRIAPWGDDDRIEYLLARHPAQCGAVVARCLERPDWLDLQGHAALWSACLDEIAWDPEPCDVTTALVRRLERAFDSASDQATLGAAARMSLELAQVGETATIGDGSPKLLRAALEIPGAALCLGAILARRELLLGAPRLETWGRIWRAKAIEAVASVFPRGEDALAVLERATQHDVPLVRCNALGVLHLLDPMRSARVLVSPERSAQQRRWIGVRLQGIELRAGVIVDSTLRSCSLREANLELARFESFEASDSDLRGARMEDSAWWSGRASSSNFARSRAARAIFVNCALEHSSWRHADLERSLWEEVDASNSRFDAARLVDAELRHCLLVGAQLGSVDLSRALFERCDLSSCDFQAARLDHAVFRECSMQRTEWSHVIAPGIELSACALKKADLTGSVLTGSSLQGSSLEAAGLADVSWVGCDLRDVDFTHASFHLGSTRSGLLVGAPPSWGTRTGFYPRDDGIDSSARPDRVRKADLRECDLRGAELERCDFYLVDLRGARLSASQVDHLRRCKAILDREPRID